MPFVQALVVSHGADIEKASLQGTVAEAAPLITDTDLTVTALSLRLAESILKHQPAAAPEVVQQVWSAVLHSRAAVSKLDSQQLLR